DEPAMETRRSLLLTWAGGFAAVGAAAAIWPLIDSLAPSAAELASGAPLDVDLAHIQPGSQKVIQWRGLPIFLVQRTPKEPGVLRESADTVLLSDPESSAFQQPSYAKNWHRSIKPEFLVLVGICTHLGCVPQFKPTPNQIGPNWLGGYFCPCHGSKYDLSG